MQRWGCWQCSLHRRSATRVLCTPPSRRHREEARRESREEQLQSIRHGRRNGIRCAAYGGGLAHDASPLAVLDRDNRGRRGRDPAQLLVARAVDVARAINGRWCRGATPALSCRRRMHFDCWQPSDHDTWRGVPARRGHHRKHRSRGAHEPRELLGGRSVGLPRIRERPT